jgi:hypothetical protein
MRTVEWATKKLADAGFPTVEALKVLDASKINIFLDCPRQFFYSHILGWQSERPNNHLIFGQAWHEAMEVLLFEGYSESSIAKAYDAFLTLYRKHFSEETDSLFAPKTPANALRALVDYCTFYKNDLQNFRPLHVEIAGRVNIAEGKFIHFRMDSICEDLQTNELFSLEHKTKNSTFNRQWIDQWTNSFQVGVYLHVLYCFAVDRKVRKVVINGIAFTNKETKFIRVPVLKTPTQMQEWLAHAEWYYDAIVQEMDFLAHEYRKKDSIMMAFPKNPQACTKYFGCPFLDFCSVKTNPWDYISQPPLGLVIRHWDPTTLPSKTQMDV